MNWHRSVILQLHHRDAHQLIRWILLLELGFQVLYWIEGLYTTWKDIINFLILINKRLNYKLSIQKITNKLPVSSISTTFFVQVSRVTLERKDFSALTMVFFTLLKCWLALQQEELVGVGGPGLISTPDLMRSIWTTVKMACSNRTLVRKWSSVAPM